MSDKLAKHLQRMQRQYEDYKREFARDGSISAEEARILKAVAGKIAALRKRVEEYESAQAAPTDAAAAPAPKETWTACSMSGKRTGLPGAFLSKLDNICGRMKSQGHPTRIAWGMRTLAQQVEIATRGRTFPQFKTFTLAEATAGRISGPDAQKWIDYYDPSVGKHAMASGFPKPVTWTLKSRHMSGRAADVVHSTSGWGVGSSFWNALQTAAEAEGCHIGPPASDRAHVEY